jgi:hypothetical protein
MLANTTTMLDKIIAANSALSKRRPATVSDSKTIFDMRCLIGSVFVLGDVIKN